MTVKKLGQCQVEGCNNKAKYGLYRTDSKGNKEWLYICSKHEGSIGYENIRRAGGYARDNYEREKGGKR